MPFECFSTRRPTTVGAYRAVHVTRILRVGLVAACRARSARFRPPAGTPESPNRLARQSSLAILARRQHKAASRRCRLTARLPPPPPPPPPAATQPHPLH